MHRRFVAISVFFCILLVSTICSAKLQDSMLEEYKISNTSVDMQVCSARSNFVYRFCMMRCLPTETEDEKEKSACLHYCFAISSDYFYSCAIGAPERR